jgi:CRP-like cAMP-binding protein
VALEAGDTICFQGAECGHLALVLSGSARVYELAESGRGQVLVLDATGLGAKIQES